jgi:hypothetical protein
MVIDNVREAIIDLLDDEGINVDEAVSAMVAAIWELANRTNDPQGVVDVAVESRLPPGCRIGAYRHPPFCAPGGRGQ